MPFRASETKIFPIENQNVDDTEKKEDTFIEVENDPWALPAFKSTQKPWKELNGKARAKRVLGYIFKMIALLVLLYLFICSLDFLSSAFRLLGGKEAGNLMTNSVIMQNPVAGLMIGVLTTVLVQSSSTSTSIVVTMVGAGILTTKVSIPIVMGANIGTSVTNTIVSMGHIADKNEFRRAFAGATVHDMFNWLTVLVFLPIEVISGYLYHLSGAIIGSMSLQTYTDGKQELLKTITKPFTSLFIQIDKKIINKIAAGNKDAYGKSMMKIWCKKEIVLAPVNVTYLNTTGGVNRTYIEEEMKNVTRNIERCKYMFMNVAGVWSDALIGGILLIISLLILCFCLFFIVKLLNSLLKGQIAVALRKFINADFPGKISWLTGYLAILIGAGLTVVVQSSSIFTSALTPLVGVGVLSIERMYPLTLGANIGTTATATLASLATDGKNLPFALQVAFVHLFFNISGILLWYPIPTLRKIPINSAKFLGNETSKYRWFALLYLIIMFFLIPLLIFGLSMISWIALVAVMAPIVLIVIFVAIVKVIQQKRPHWLPEKFRNWKFLPEFMRSLAPYDRLIHKLHCFKCIKCKAKSKKSFELNHVIEKGTQNPGFTESNEPVYMYNNKPSVDI